MRVNICPKCLKLLSSPGVCPVCGFVSSDYVPKQPHLPAGTVLNGRYALGRVLGDGGFGITYLGLDMALELRVAVKEYSPDGYAARDNSISDRIEPLPVKGAEEFFSSGKRKYLQEARIMARCDSIPQVVRVRDFFEDNNTVYIIMDYIDGETLTSYTKRRGGRLSPAECISIFTPAIKAMENVHKQANLLHRDLSADNIMLLPNGDIRILDFGAAKNATSGENTTSSLLLKRGASPIEQYSGSAKQGPHTDVYAMAATMYFCMTGAYPPESVDRMVSDTLVPPSQKGVSIAPAVENALLHALAVRPENRTQTMAQFLSELTAQSVSVPPAVSYNRPQSASAVNTASVQPVTVLPAQSASRAQAQNAVPVSVRGSAPGAFSAGKSQPVQNVQNKERSTRRKLITALAVAGAVLLTLVIALVVSLSSGSKNTVKENESSVSGKIEAGDTELSGTQADDSKTLEPGEVTDENDVSELVCNNTDYLNNVLNWGCFSGDYDNRTLYICDENLSLVIVRPDGTTQTNYGRSTYYVNVSGDTVYYINPYASKYQIVALNSQTMETEVLYTGYEDLDCLVLENGTLYFVRDKSDICSLVPGEDNAGVLYSGNGISDFTLYNRGFYWLEDGALYAMDAVGGKAADIYSGSDILFFQLYEDKLYCSSKSELLILGQDGKILDRMDMTTLYFNIHGGYIYYADMAAHEIYRRPISGSSAELICACDDNMYPLNLCITEYKGKTALWYMSYDGEETYETGIFVYEYGKWGEVTPTYLINK